MAQPEYSKDTYQKLSIPTDGVSVTPSDSVNLASPGTLYVGGSGTLIAQVESGTNLTFTGFSGFLPLRVTRVISTGTTATDIVALF